MDVVGAGAGPGEEDRASGAKALLSWMARPIVFVPVVLALMGVLLVGGALHDSPTIDEPSHLSRGLAAWSTGDMKMSYAHPPLANLIQAIPAGISGKNFDVESLRGWDEWSIRRLNASILSKYEKARRFILSGRLMTAFLTLSLGLYLYFSLSTFGPAVARWGLFLFALHPLFLAHGRVMTTDLAITFAVVVTVGELIRYLKTRTLLPLLGVSLAVGAALSIKYNGLFLVPFIAIALAIAAARGCARFPADSPWWMRAARASRDFVVMGFVGSLVINASYGFQRTGMTVGELLEHPEPPYWLVTRYEGETLRRLSPLPMLPQELPIPLPYPYLFGISTIRAQNERGHGGWFLGERTSESSLVYFPTMLAIKTPAAMSLLLLLSLALFFRRPFLPKAEGWVLVLVPVGFFALSMTSNIQIGARHLMPVVPFLIGAAAWAAARLEEWGRWGRGLAVGLVGLMVAEVAWTHPKHISHFNLLIGGPEVGHLISLVGEDWGQDVGELARVVKEEGLQPLTYYTFGSASRRELAHHGVRFRPMRCNRKVEGPGWVAVHAVQYLRLRKGCGPIPPGRLPDRKINHHIWLYRLE